MVDLYHNGGADKVFTLYISYLMGKINMQNKYLINVIKENILKYRIMRIGISI